jgi:hypothetical protein
MKKSEWLASEALAEATGQVATATGLETAAAREAVLMSAKGVPLEYAVAAAKNGATEATLRQAAVTALGEQATEEEIQAKMKEIAIEQYGAGVKQIGILARI